MNKRERRDLTKTVICDCGCGAMFHPLMYKKTKYSFVAPSHYGKFRREHHIIGRRKLTLPQVQEINSLRGKATSSQLAEQYGVHLKTIEDIWYGNSWNHITHNKTTH